MTTRDLAKRLLNRTSVDDVEAELVTFLVDFLSGYGVAYGEGERGKAREYAVENNYSWLPCVLCGTWRGGQERCHALALEPFTGILVCDGCKLEAARLNALFPQGVARSREAR